MTPTGASPAAAIPPEVTELLDAGAILYVGSRSAHRHPECMPAAGARVEDAGRLTIHLAEALAGPTVANLRDNGRVALTICRVTDNRSLQLKGTLVEVRQADEADRQYLGRLLDRRREELAIVGMPRSVSARMVWWPCLVLEVRVDELFDQTPGPRAGHPLGQRAP